MMQAFRRRGDVAETHERIGDLIHVARMTNWVARAAITKAD
jgi:hypothetical protein